MITIARFWNPAFGDQKSALWKETQRVTKTFVIIILILNESVNFFAESPRKGDVFSEKIFRGCLPFMDGFRREYIFDTLPFKAGFTMCIFFS